MAAKNVMKNVSARRKTTKPITFCIKRERNALFKKVSAIVQKPEQDITDEEKEVLRNCSELVKEVKQRLVKRQRLKDRLQEVEDPPHLLAEKCSSLAAAIASSGKLVVYTGAGISTAARIPDYRGTNGIWTLLQQGKDIGPHDLTRAEPTLTHMALAALHRAGVLKHVVSQNCDGLHLRSGLPRQALSEVHGNMYIEVCRSCKPAREYLRLFDVTEHTARFNHRTRRRCYVCSTPLVDTIVHFGERGTLQWPLNWPGACRAADSADVILCLGSSLKVLKKYSWLWGMDRPVKKRPKLYIVNLQWTPKDEQAVLKINGKCDEVMRQVMQQLNIGVPSYSRGNDPIFSHTTGLHPAEQHTTSHPLLAGPADATPPDKPILIEIIDCKSDAAILDLVKKEPVPSDGAVVTYKQEMTSDSSLVLQETSFHFVNVEINKESGSQFGWNQFLESGGQDPFHNVANTSRRLEETITGVASEVFEGRSNFSVASILSSSLEREGDRRYLCCPNKLVSNCQCDVGVGSFGVYSWLDRSETALDLTVRRRGPERQRASAGMTCSFCLAHYNSVSCLFYVPRRPEFKILLLGSDPDAAICECCDKGSDDEDGDSEADDEEDCENTGQDISPKQEGEDLGKSPLNKVPVINPGWFGKGCRKKNKRKRVDSR